MYIKTVNGFNIHLNLLDDDTPITDNFDLSETETKKIIDDVKSGKLLYFRAEVKANKKGIELATEYLGGCFYESPNDFIENSGYFDDMVKTVVKNAKQVIKELAIS